MRRVQRLDREALVALYNATDGANWTNKDKWLSEDPIGDWQGVTTDTDGRVTGLNLSSNQLSGTIPTAIGDLANLESIQLAFNQLSGSIPATLGNLANLETIHFVYNQLSMVGPDH